MTRLYPLLEPLVHLSPTENVRLSFYADDASGFQIDPTLIGQPHGQYRHTQFMDDALLSRTILADNVDVLIDLTGHGNDSRLGVIARRSAPLQVSWAGWLATTGLSSMDCIVVDATALGVGSNETFREHVIQLSGGLFSCMPPQQDQNPPVVQDTIEPTLNQSIALGSVCSPMQLSDRLVATWCKLLRQLPEARLQLADRAYKDASVCREVVDKFRTREVDPSRIELVASDDYRLFVKSLQVTLDPFPWNTPEVTCLSLGEGVPVVAWLGDRLSCRASASVLRSAGLNAWVAESLDAYCQTAVELAHHPVSRKALKDQLIGSPLCDTTNWVREFVSQIRQRFEKQLHNQSR